MELSVLILQVITITISVVTIIVNVFLTKSENKRSRFINVVTEQRVKNFRNARAAVKELLARTRPGYAERVDKNDLLAMSAAVAEMETTFHDYYIEDKELMDLSDSLFLEISRPKPDMKSVSEARNKLFRAFAIFDLADWRFLKAQSDGSAFGSGDFDRYYDGTKADYEKKLANRK